MAKNKVYAVIKGKTPGIYFSWDDCKEQTLGFSGAIFKGFETEDEARKYYETQSKPNIWEKYMYFTEEEMVELSQEYPDTTFAFVDGSFLNDVGYASGAILFNNGNIEKYASAGTNAEEMVIRNVAGEINASKYAIDKALCNESEKVVIFYDYEGIERWATGAWAANTVPTIAYQKYCADMSSLIKIEFCKVHGHTGIPMNEKVDILAKSALGIN